jgi:alanine-glyoxylate transaminase/serine-glyoxylate transaminase/serine-pyruvate transaminase
MEAPTLSGRHFLQIPGPTNVPERVQRAMDRAVADHRGRELPELTYECIAGLKEVFGTSAGHVVFYSGSGSSAWEGSIVNTLSPGSRVLAFNLGFFSHTYAEVARRLGMDVDEVDLDWGLGTPAAVVQEKLAADRAHTYKAVLVVHNETSTGVTSDVAAVRRAIDAAAHPALLLVDCVSSLGSMDFRMDEWGVDVALTGSQKGLMLPPGMALIAMSPRALERCDQVETPRWTADWRPLLESQRAGFFPNTPPTLLVFGLREALLMLREEGLDNVYRRHARLAEGVRQAVQAWDLGLLCRDAAERSNSLTAVMTPPEVDTDQVLRIAEARLNLSLGNGLARLKGRVFRIGHLGSLNELEVMGTLAGCEMALRLAGMPVEPGSGLVAAQAHFARTLEDS